MASSCASRRPSIFRSYSHCEGWRFKIRSMPFYTNFFLIRFTMAKGAVSHDRITCFLSRQNYTSKDLWRQVKAMVRQVDDVQGVLIFDDTIQEKAWTDESDLICWHYDHCSGRTVKGINLLNALYHSNATGDTSGKAQK